MAKQRFGNYRKLGGENFRLVGIIPTHKEARTIAERHRAMGHKARIEESLTHQGLVYGVYVQ